MKAISILLAVCAVAAGIYIVLRDPAVEPSPETGNGGRPIPGGKTTQRTDHDDLPGGGMVSPAMIGAGPEEVYAEFVAEHNLSQAEAKEFFEALAESNENLKVFLPAVDGLENPTIPSPEELDEHLAEKEDLLRDALGDERYDQFKSYTAMLPARRLINGLGSGLGISDQQKADILGGAYEDIQSGAIPASPDEYFKAMSSAILKRSSEHLSEAGQKKLAKALEAGVAAGMVPAISPPPPPPGATDLPMPPAGIPRRQPGGPASPPTVIP